MGTIDQLIPSVVVCAAFVAILVAVKRHANREEAEDRAARLAENDQTLDRKAPGPRVHMVPVEDDGPEPPERKGQ
jgi:hypothetical protein